MEVRRFEKSFVRAAPTVAPGRVRRLAPRPGHSPHGGACASARTALLPRPDPSPNQTAAEPDGRRVLSRVGAADHAVTPGALWTGCGWREYSYSRFGGGHPRFHPHATPAGNLRIKRQARPYRKPSKSVRSLGLTWIFSPAAVHQDPVSSDGAARVAAWPPGQSTASKIGNGSARALPTLCCAVLF